MSNITKADLKKKQLETQLLHAAKQLLNVSNSKSMIITLTRRTLLKVEDQDVTAMIEKKVKSKSHE